MCTSVPNLILMTAKAPHSARKRLMANVYSRTFVQNSKELAASSAYLVQEQLLLHLTATAASPTPNVEVLELMSATT